MRERDSCVHLARGESKLKLLFVDSIVKKKQKGRRRKKPKQTKTQTSVETEGQ